VTVFQWKEIQFGTRGESRPHCPCGLPQFSPWQVLGKKYDPLPCNNTPLFLGTKIAAEFDYLILPQINEGF